MSSNTNLMDSILESQGFSPGKTLSHELWMESLGNPVKDFLGRKSKRIRAELITVAFQVAGGIGQPPMQIIEFVELLHAGSLVIDDIEDNSRNRRQKETLHIKYGVPTALNTGNWMYFAALEMLANVDCDPQRKLAVIKKVLRVIRRCHEGQALDLTATFDDCPPSEIPAVVGQISNLKTGALTSLAAWLGGVMANADKLSCLRLSGFGRSLGIGLQMQNDFVELQKVATSQCNSDDFRNRRVTWPWAWLAQTCSVNEMKYFARMARVQMPDVQKCAQLMLERVEIKAVQEINKKLEGSIQNIQNLNIPPKVEEKLDRIIATLELHYV